jgi:glycosyltransferase involved in cell wall biosynthesis
MLAKFAVADELSRPSIEALRVAILMATKDGAAFLGEQLTSIARQTHANWSLVISDDGSTDQTRAIIERFAREHPQRVRLLDGPRRGVCANFMALATDPSIEADYFAFSDQDDVWHADKLQRALAWFRNVPDAVPGMYCGRTELMSADGHCYGLSPLFRRAPSFQNALVQSLGGGNTMLFNRATKKLLERVGPLEVVLHDWWVYQLVSAAGGMIRYDPQPVLKYRQHERSLIGSNLGPRARLTRISMILGGRLQLWNRTNIAALQRVPSDLIKSQNRAVIALFGEATTAPLLKRLIYLRRSGVYRQTVLDNIGMIAAAILKRI